MRLVFGSLCVGLGLAGLACDNASVGIPNCPTGQQPCNGTCVATGNCGTTSNQGGGSSTTAPTGGSTQTPGTGGAATGGAATGGKPATGGAATGGSSVVGDPTVCDDTATTKSSMSGQYSRLYINTTNNPTKNYVAITNWWHLYKDQTVDVNGIGFKVGNTQASPSGDNSPVGFPTVFIGTYQDNASNGSNLPKQVSAITSAPTVFDTNATSLDTANFNATYDIWLTASSALLNGKTVSSPGTGGAYVMLWLYKPANRQPRGSIRASAQTVGKLSNTWDVWVDSTNPPCISYVAKTPISTISYDLKELLTDATKYGVSASMYLSIVFAGFEIWGGANGATINQFCAKVN
jgi:hypothetical protein